MDGYSLWLLPCADDEAVLRPLMATLADLFGHAPFEPHITVQGDLHQEPGFLGQIAAEAAARTPALEWNPPLWGRSPFYFRVFFLRFAETHAFDALSNEIVSRVQTAQGRSPYPHLSLAYGEAARAPGSADLVDLVESAHPGILDELGSRSFRFDRLAVVLSAKTVPLDQWRVLEAFPLGSVS